MATRKIRSIQELDQQLRDHISGHVEWYNTNSEQRNLMNNRIRSLEAEVKVMTNEYAKAIGDLCREVEALKRQRTPHNPREAQYILIHGNPVDGMEYYGPFNDPTDANELGERLGGDWWVKDLTL